MRSEKPRLRKREVALALTAGVVAAGGAALILSDNDERPAIAAAALELAYDGTPFEELTTVGPQNVVVTVGESHSVRWEGSPEALARLQVTVEDGTLTIRPRSGIRRGFNWSGRNTPTFHVTTPRLDSVSLAGSGDVRVERIEGERFAGAIAGSGALTIGALQVEAADFSIAGSGDVVAAGTARRTEVSILGSGDVRANGLRSEAAEVSIAGSGDVALTVDGQAQVSIMGSGDVDIAGAATCTVSRMGRGDVRCGDTNVGN